METKFIDHFRDDFHPQSTLGYISLEGKKFCYTLEDTLRPYGVKVYEHTGLPENPQGYKVGIRRSNKFKRDVLVLYTEKDGITLTHYGISFKYAYIHGGNSHKDTEGCVLVAFNKHGNKIQGTAEKALFKIVKKWIDAGHDVYWRTFNKI